MALPLRHRPLPIPARLTGLGTRPVAGVPDLRARVARLGAFVLGGALVVALATVTGHGWAAAVTLQKLTVWTLLWLLLGLGGGTALGGRGARPVAVTHWLRPGTVRLPPRAGRALPTAGTRRTHVDVALHVSVLVVAVVALVGPTAGGGIPRGVVAALLVGLAVLALRDRVPVLAARPDVLGPLLLVAVFAPGNTVFAAKLCLAGWWWGGAVATLNPSYPAQLAAAAEQAPWRPLLEPFVRSLRGGDGAPSPRARVLAVAVAVLQLVLPLALLLARGGAAAALAVALMVALQLAAISTLRPGVALEVEAFVLVATVLLFGARAAVGATSLTSLPLAVLLAVVLTGRVLLGAVAPDRVSPVLTMRARSGTEPAALWLLRDDVTPVHHPRLAPNPHVVAAFDDPGAEPRRLPRTTALLGLVDRAVDEPARYRLLDAEQVAEVVLGCGLGDGHLAGDDLAEAIWQGLTFVPGQVRVVVLDASGPRRRVRYRIIDAVGGPVERGTVARESLAADGPLDTVVDFQVLPRVEVLRSTGPRPAAAPAPEPVRPRPRPAPRGGS